MTWDALEKAGADLLRRLGPSALRTVLDHALDAWPRDAILRATPGAEALLDALAGVDRSAGLPYLAGLAAGYAQRAGRSAWRRCGVARLPTTYRCGPPPPSLPT
jgi:hypothetical protein